MGGLKQVYFGHVKGPPRLNANLVDQAHRVCPNCSDVSFLREDQVFCVACGTSLTALCPSCSMPVLHPQGKFCHHCGSLINRTQSSAGESLGVMGQRPPLGVEHWVRQQRQHSDVKLPRVQSVVRRKP
jgi:hypothetical protein